MEKIVEKFLNYVSFDTQSKEDSKTFPSTLKQLELAKYLKDELEKIGVNTILDEYGYVYGLIPSNTEKNVKKIGFIAHMDTSPEVSGKDVKAKVIEKYTGENIILNDKKVLSKDNFPELLNYIGEDIIVTDGNTLLGSDDKAGIAEIMQAIEEVIENKSPHGDIYIAFTPDEEIGRGTDHFNFNIFKADFAYTLDGEGYGIFEFENFNAASANFYIKGINTHPGIAKGFMRNSLQIANELMNMFPRFEVPETTEHYEGFYHFYEIKGSVEETFLKAIIRDHNKEKFEKRKNFCNEVVTFLNNKYGNGTVTLTLEDSYYNMRELIEKYPFIINLAKRAYEMAGVDFITKPIRGGTDGARLTYAGLPTPNIFSGGRNLHSVYEYISVKSMNKAKEIVKNIIKILVEEE